MFILILKFSDLNSGILKKTMKSNQLRESCNRKTLIIAKKLII